MGLKYLDKLIKGKTGELQIGKEGRLLVDGESMVYMLPEKLKGMLCMKEMEDVVRKEVAEWLGVVGRERVVVFFDGSSGECKIQTSIKRRKKKRQFSVPLLKVMFKMVLKEQNITVMQCWGEADNSILCAAMSNPPETFILTRDNDFFCSGANLLTRSNLDIKLGEAVRYPSVDVAEVLGLEPRHLPLYALLIESDYIQYEDVKFVYEKIYPKIDAETLKMMNSREEYPSTFLNAVGCYVRGLEDRTQKFDIHTKIGASNVLHALLVDCPPPNNTIITKLWDAFLEFCPVPKTSPAGLPPNFRTAFENGDLDCDFADICIGVEWWADPLAELTGTTPPIVMLPYFTNIRELLYGYAMKEHRVKEYCGDARTYKEYEQRKPKALEVNGIRYSLRSVWGYDATTQDVPFNERLSVVSHILLQSNRLKAEGEWVVGLVLACLVLAVPKGGVANFELSAVLDSLRSKGWGKCGDCAKDIEKGHREAQLFAAVTSVLIHLGYVFDALRIEERTSRGWVSLCPALFYYSYKQYLPSETREPRDFLKASTTFTPPPSHQPMFDLVDGFLPPDRRTATLATTCHAEGFYTSEMDKNCPDRSPGSKRV